MAIKETKELFEFLLSIFDFIRVSKSDDGKVKASDLIKNPTHVFDVSRDGVIAITGADKIPMELASMNEDEANEIKTMLKDRFDIDDDQAELYYEDVILHGFALARTFARMSNI